MVWKARPSKGTTINTWFECFLQLVEEVSITISAPSEIVIGWIENRRRFSEHSNVHWTLNLFLQLECPIKWAVPIFNMDKKFHWNLIDLAVIW